jgi:guanine deaminase
MTLYRGTFIDTPENPFDGGGLRSTATRGCWSRTG